MREGLGIAGARNQRRQRVLCAPETKISGHPSAKGFVFAPALIWNPQETEVGDHAAAHKAD